jgi:hypothetical protein
MLGHQILRVRENSPEKTFKLVGLHIDEKLTFKHHITVQKKFGQSIAMICRSKKPLPKQIIILSFKALVMSHLEYCVAIWGGAVPSVTKQLLIKQTKRHSGWLREQNTTHTQTRFLLQPTH